jgi:hypothetical protein
MGKATVGDAIGLGRALVGETAGKIRKPIGAAVAGGWRSPGSTSGNGVSGRTAVGAIQFPSVLRL